MPASTQSRKISTCDVKDVQTSRRRDVRTLRRPGVRRSGCHDVKTGSPTARLGPPVDPSLSARESSKLANIGHHLASPAKKSAAWPQTPTPKNRLEFGKGRPVQGRPSPARPSATALRDPSLTQPSAPFRSVPLHPNHQIPHPVLPYSPHPLNLQSHTLPQSIPHSRPPSSHGAPPSLHLSAISDCSPIAPR
jgi:hypothetical protein